MARIEPYENGLHSFAKAREAFSSFHAAPEDVYALKDAILRSHHALETILKAYLYKHNPVLILEDVIKIKDAVESYAAFASGTAPFLFSENRTIGLVEALDRLRLLGRLSDFSEEEFQATKRAAVDLVATRNCLQHLGLEADLEIIARPLGSLLPRVADLLKRLDPTFEPRITSFYPNALETVALLRSEYDELVRKAVTFFREKTFAGISLMVKSD